MERKGREGWPPYHLTLGGTRYVVHYDGKVYLRKGGTLRRVRDQAEITKVLEAFVKREGANTLTKALRELLNMGHDGWI